MKKLYFIFVLLLSSTLLLGSTFNIKAANKNTISTAKTASSLNANKETQVKLSFPGKEDKLGSDIVFVLDKSGMSAQNDIYTQAKVFLKNIKEQAKDKNLDVKIGVVLFNSIGNIKQKLTDISTDKGYKDILKALNSSVSMGTNMHAGLLAAQKMLEDDKTVADSRKHMILISDGATYLYSKNKDYTKAYTRSFGNPKNQINPKTGKHYSNGSDKKGGIWEYQSRDYNTESTAPKFYNANTAEKLKAYLNEKRIHDKDFQKYEYEYNFASAYLNIGRKVMPISSDAVANIEAGFIYAWDTYKQIDSKYNTYVYYKNAADFDGSEFLKLLKGGELDTSFTELENKVTTMISKGSRVVDFIGRHFDFINDLNKIQIKSGSSVLDKERISNYRYGFGKRSDNTYRYELIYTPGDNEKIELKVNESVKADNLLELTYFEKLTVIPEKPGEYTFKTNEKAILYPIDSNKKPGKALVFPIPQVTYTVKKIEIKETEKKIKEKHKIKPEKKEVKPQTGDHTAIFAMIILVIGSVIGMIVLIRKKSK